MSDESEVALILRRFEESTEPFDEHDVDSALLSLKPKDDKDWQPPTDYLAERTAFAFDERITDEQDGNYTWFAPMMSGRYDDGTPWEWPSVSGITKEMLDYWIERAKAAHHPILKARYAGLAWEFSPQVTGGSAPIEMAHIRVDAVLVMAAHDHHEHDVEVCGKLGQALGLAIAINDQFRIEKARNAIIEYEKKVGADDKPGLWGRAFDLLYDNKRALLTAPQRDALIADLEDRLDRVSDVEAAPTSVDPWAAEAAAQRLAIHYRKEDKTDDVRRVLLKVGRAFDHMAEKAEPMVAQAWFEQVERLYRRFSLAEEASEVRRKIRELGPAAHAKLVRHEHKMEIKKEDMDAYVNQMLEGDLEQAISRFVIYLIPRRHQTEEQLKELAKEAVMMFLFTRKIVDGKGRPIASLGSLEEDMDGHVVAQTAQNLVVMGIWVRCVVEEMIKRFGVDTTLVMGRIAECPVFDESKHDIIQRGLDAYFAGDAMTAIHFLVPQVEDAVRTLIELAGGDVYKPNRQGGMDLRSFDDLLRHPVLTHILNSDATEYLRVLYTDRRGINLRNNVCHGMLAAGGFGMGLADRVFHTLMMLSQIRRKNNDGQDEATSV